MSSIWEYVTMESLGFQQARNEFQRFKTYISESTQKAQTGANKLLRVVRLHQEILMLASSTDTYDDPQKIEELKSKAQDLKDLKHEINTYCQSYFRPYSS